LKRPEKWLNPQFGGEIQDASEISAIQQLINKNYPVNKPIAVKDENQTNLKGGKDGVLVYPLKLAHT
jgi:hypothetical protein